MDQASAEQRVGTTLCGKWTLERLLGVGGMAAVYASAHKIGRRDAIKILHLDVAKNADLRARFEQEAHVANRFKHPGAVEIRDVDVTEDGCPLLVMELLEGETLSEKSRRSPPELPDILRWTDELLDVLAAAHVQGIIHRDIKLDNLFITTDGRLKVLDFGIARVRDGAVKSWKTAIGATLGTAPYMPPEQVQGREIDGRADIFAVGATMFRLIARRRVHDAQTEPELLAKMATQPAPPLATVTTNVPPNVCLVVDRALRFKKEDRYPDAATMQADIREIRAGLPPTHATQRIVQGDAPSTSAAPTPILGATARAVTGGTGPKTMATMAASPSSIRVAPTIPGAPASALADARAITHGPPPGSSASSAPAISWTGVGAVSAQTAAAINGSTLKSAAVVPLPGATTGPESTGVAVPVVPPPPRRRLPTSGSLRLFLVGGAFLLLGVLIAIVVMSGSGSDGNAARTEEGEAKRNANATHAAKPAAVNLPMPEHQPLRQPANEAPSSSPRDTTHDPTPSPSSPSHDSPGAHDPQNNSNGQGQGDHDRGGGPKPGRGKGHGKKD